MTLLESESSSFDGVGTRHPSRVSAPASTDGSDPAGLL